MWNKDCVNCTQTRGKIKSRGKVRTAESMLLETALLWLIVVKACIPVLNITRVNVNLRMLRLIKLNITQVSLKRLRSACLRLALNITRLSKDVYSLQFNTPSAVCIFPSVCSPQYVFHTDRLSLKMFSLIVTYPKTESAARFEKARHTCWPGLVMSP